jgi:hypothetical protein
MATQLHEICILVFTFAGKSELGGSVLDTTRSGIPEAVRNFLHSSINTVEQLESLLLMRKNRDHEFSVALLVEKQYTSELAATTTLGSLVASGLARPTENGTYIYNAGPEVDAVIEQLEKLYRSRRVSVISTIYNRP